MPKNTIKGFSLCTTMGLLPLLIFYILIETVGNEIVVFAIPFVLSVTGDFLYRYFSVSKIFSISFVVSAISIGTTFVFWTISKRYVDSEYITVAFAEIVIFTLYSIISINKTFIKSRFTHKKGLLHKTVLHEFYHMVKIIQLLSAFHLFFILLYKYFNNTDINILHTSAVDTVVYIGVPVFFIIFIIVYEAVKRSLIFTRLSKEEWLPIITPKGEVTGRIAKSVSLNMKNKFMHPVVRVALISGDQIYLQNRSVNDVFDAGKLDYPFEKYMLFSHEINLAARNSITRMMNGYDDADLKFILKYTFENEKTKRLIFLFAMNVPDMNSIKKDGRMTGKFWTIKQIEENFKDEIFGECFEMEFEYMKNVVLNAEKDKS